MKNRTIKMLKANENIAKKKWEESGRNVEKLYARGVKNSHLQKSCL